MAVLGEELPNNKDPTSFHAAMNTEYCGQWTEACKSELKGIEDMEVFKIRGPKRLQDPER